MSFGGTLKGDRVSPTSSRLVHSSTEMPPEPKRFAAFRQEFARRVLTTDLVDRGGRPLIGVTFMRLGAAAVGSIAGMPAEFIRRKHHVQHGGEIST